MGVRSLMTKLVAAFLLISVGGMVLAAVFIQRSVTAEFDDYVITQQRNTFITNVSNYYATNGSWEGLDRWLRESVFARRPGPSYGPKHAGGPAQGYPFVLTDADGTVIGPFGGYESGQTVSAEARAKGVPVTIDDVTVGYVLTAQPENFRNPDEERYLARTRRGLSIAAVIALSIALIFGVVLARLITRPLRELTVAAENIANGNLDQRVPVRSRDEIGVLATQFNRMSSDLNHAIQLRHQMTADIAHDLRTPLTVLSGYLEALRDEVLKPTPTRFATLYDETQLLLRLVEDLHTLSLADAGELPGTRRPLDPGALLERVAATYHHSAVQHGVELSVTPDPATPPIEVDPEQMARVLNNLVSNALRYTPSGGRVSLSTYAVPAGVELVVADTGEGIAAEHLPNIFERFYRADSSRHEHTGGSGLGLTIVKSIVELHGGSIRAASREGQGTRFTITLPASQTPVAEPVLA